MEAKVLLLLNATKNYCCGCDERFSTVAWTARRVWKGIKRASSNKIMRKHPHKNKTTKTTNHEQLLSALREAPAYRASGANQTHNKATVSTVWFRYSQAHAQAIAKNADTLKSERTRRNMRTYRASYVDKCEPGLVTHFGKHFCSAVVIIVVIIIVASIWWAWSFGFDKYNGNHTIHEHRKTNNVRRQYNLQGCG